MPAMSDLISRHDAAVAPVLSFDTDVVVDRAEGLWVYDHEGNRWADFACGTAVTNLGHNHPEVVAAAMEQMGRVVHSGCVFRYESIVRAAERLAEITPPGIEMFGFANSGAEAVEAAVKLARKTSGRQAVIAFRGGFHGRTMGSVSYTTSNAKYRDGYHPVLGSVLVSPFPHPYRWGLDEEQATDLALDELQRMFRHEISPGHVACFLIEPVQGEGGYYPAPVRFLQELRRIADEQGILLVFDEVQTGFGRTGGWTAADHYGIAPDVIALGKGISQRPASVGLRLVAGADGHVAGGIARNHLRRQPCGLRRRRGGDGGHGRSAPPRRLPVGASLRAVPQGASHLFDDR